MLTTLCKSYLITLGSRGLSKTNLIRSRQRVSVGACHEPCRRILPDPLELSLTEVVDIHARKGIPFPPALAVVESDSDAVVHGLPCTQSSFFGVDVPAAAGADRGRRGLPGIEASGALSLEDGLPPASPTRAGEASRTSLLLGVGDSSVFVTMGIGS